LRRVADFLLPDNFFADFFLADLEAVLFDFDVVDELRLPPKMESQLSEYFLFVPTRVMLMTDVFSRS
jgi:hypothetical protein